MIILLHISIGLAVGIGFIPALFLLLETIAAFLPQRKRDPGLRPPSIAVIVPAHNEAEYISATLKDIALQLEAADKLIVVADNCNDDTASVARAHGAIAITRDEPGKRGKGYALQYAIDYLKRTQAPECVVFFDADCRLSEGVIDHLSKVAHKSRRPAQALYLMNAPEPGDLKNKVAMFAWIMINHVRMKGLFKIADVTRFTGTGMAAPWEVITKISFTGGHITEDLVATKNMAALGVAPIFEPTVTVTSHFPSFHSASLEQRARWEHGSLGVLVNNSMPMFLRALTKRNAQLFFLALDLMIPPLTIFVFGLAFISLAALVSSPLIGAAPFILSLLSLALVGLSVATSWIGFGRRVLPTNLLWMIVPFLLQKISIYGKVGRASSKTWTRTQRDK